MNEHLTDRPRSGAARVAAALLFACALAAGALAASSATPPEPVDEGEFRGTWARLDPVNQQALTLRPGPRGRGWQIRLQWRTSRGFSVDTGWQRKVEFEHKGHPGSIEIEVDAKRSNAQRIVFSWTRVQEGARGSTMTETGGGTLHRAGRGGRALVWHQPELVRTIVVEEPILPEEIDVPPRTDSVLWFFEKQSVRELAWDEVYW